MEFSLPHLLMALLVFVLLFGAKKIPEIAGSMGKGIKEFKKGMNEALEDDPRQTQFRDDPRALTARQESAPNVDEEPRREPKRLVDSASGYKEDAGRRT
jgi:sec-independent protein translocase protein TatA